MLIWLECREEERRISSDWRTHGSMAGNSWPYFDPEYENLSIRINPPRFFFYPSFQELNCLINSLHDCTIFGETSTCHKNLCCLKVNQTMYLKLKDPPYPLGKLLNLSL